MTSIIKELQRDAMDPGVRTSDLLRKALVVAAELGLKEFQDWVALELNGYGDDWESVPAYRRLGGQVKALNPYHGWQPVAFKDAAVTESLSRVAVTVPVGEIEDSGDGDMAVTFTEEVAADIRKAIGQQVEVQRHVSGASFRGIADAVRNQILDWTIKLSDAGVTGDGLTFTPVEKKAAGDVTTINIGSVTNLGVLGDVSGKAKVAVDQSRGFTGDELAALRSFLEQVGRYQGELGLQASEARRLRETVEAVQHQLEGPEPDGGAIRSGLASLRSILEGAAGNVIASGILTELGRFG